MTLTDNIYKAIHLLMERNNNYSESIVTHRYSEDLNIICNFCEQTITKQIIGKSEPQITIDDKIYKHLSSHLKEHSLLPFV